MNNTWLTLEGVFCIHTNHLLPSELVLAASCTVKTSVGSGIWDPFEDASPDFYWLYTSSMCGLVHHPLCRTFFQSIANQCNTIYVYSFHNPKLRDHIVRLRILDLWEFFVSFPPLVLSNYSFVYRMLIVSNSEITLATLLLMSQESIFSRC